MEAHGLDAMPALGFDLGCCRPRLSLLLGDVVFRVDFEEVIEDDEKHGGASEEDCKRVELIVGDHFGYEIGIVARDGDGLLGFLADHQRDTSLTEPTAYISQHARWMKRSSWSQPDSRRYAPFGFVAREDTLSFRDCSLALVSFLARALPPPLTPAPHQNRRRHSHFAQPRH